jgi:hypothetical protein
LHLETFRVSSNAVMSIQNISAAGLADWMWVWGDGSVKLIFSSLTHLLSHFQHFYELELIRFLF